MIVEQHAAVYNGFQMCIEAVLKSGCRHYFASPSPMQSLLLSEGLTRFQQHHGICLQTQTPTEALSMAQGVAQLGDIPFISSNYSDFLSVQQGLAHFFQQEVPCVYAVVLYQAPEFVGASTLPYGYACFQNASPVSGFPFPHLIPSHLSHVQNNVQEAFALAAYLRQPVILVLDPMLLSTTQNVQDAEWVPLDLVPMQGSHVLERAQKKHQHLQQLAPRWLRHWGPESTPDYALVATGAMGGWLLEMDWQDNAVLVLDSLYPGVLKLPEHYPIRLPLYVVEFDPGCLWEQLHQYYPQYDLRSLKTPWERSAPVGLQAAIRAQLQSKQTPEASNP